jgi:hypothetical protein
MGIVQCRMVDGVVCRESEGATGFMWSGRLKTRTELAKRYRRELEGDDGIQRAGIKRTTRREGVEVQWAGEEESSSMGRAVLWWFAGCRFSCEVLLI